MNTENIEANTENAEEAGTGPCMVAGCGCEAFSASPAGPNFPGGGTCIGRNAAGGTCNHRKDQHR